MNSRPQDVEQLFAQSDEAAAALRWSDAADLLGEAGNSTRVLDKRVFYLSRAKRYTEALDILEELRNREPQSYRHWYMTAYQYYEQQRFAEAIPFLREALKRNPDHLRSWWRAANALRQVGQHTKAQLAAGRVLQIWPNLDEEEKKRCASHCAKSAYLLGRYQAAHDAEGAEQLFRLAAELDPKDPYKHYSLGKTLLRLGRVDNAIPSLIRARELKASDPHIESQYAKALSRKGDPEGAISAILGVADRLRGHSAYQAGLLVLDCGAAGLATRLLMTAGRLSEVRAEPAFENALQKAQRLAVAAEPLAREATASDMTGTGRIQFLNLEKRFGFLRDDLEGTRRHFRTTEASALRVGDAVSFTRYEAEKGPGARLVQATQASGSVPARRTGPAVARRHRRGAGASRQRPSP